MLFTCGCSRNIPFIRFESRQNLAHLALSMLISRIDKCASGLVSVPLLFTPVYKDTGYGMDEIRNMV